MTIRQKTVFVMSICAILTSLFVVLAIVEYVRDFPSRNARVSLQRQLARIASGDMDTVSLTGHTVVMDEFVSALPQLSTMPHFALDCYDTQGTDRLLEQIHGLNNLRRVTLTSTDVSDLGVCALASMPSITHLDLYNARITQKGVDCLTALPALESIAIRPAKGSTSLIEAVLKLPHLRRVRLYETPHAPWLDIDTIINAAKPKLTTLELSGVQLSDVEFVRLQAALPNCTISVGRH
jgi:hypothetical protein